MLFDGALRDVDNAQRAYIYIYINKTLFINYYQNKFLFIYVYIYYLYINTNTCMNKCKLRQTDFQFIKHLNK